MFRLRTDSWPTRRSALLCAVELVGNEFSIPAEDGIGFRDAGNFFKRLAAEPLSDLRQSLSLAVAEAQAGQTSLQNPVFRGEVLILQQQYPG